MVYSFHHFYYWVKGGVETGLAYRAKLFRAMGQEAKFVFATTFPNHNIQHETSSLGFLDSEVIWMYGFFTDCKLSPVVYTLKQLEDSFGESKYSFSRNGTTVTYRFANSNIVYIATLTDEIGERVHRVKIVSDGHLVRKDYFTYCRIYSEYFIPENGFARLYLRRFFHEDGRVAYEELIDGSNVIYRFPDRILYSREELVGEMMSRLHLTKDDLVLIDGEPGMIDRAAFIQNAAPARVGFILHADHFLSEDADHVLWYGIYEYALAHPEKIDFYITNTTAQSDLLREQFKKYKGVEPLILTIPVVGLDEIKRPKRMRRRHALISVGRLAPEKHMDQVIKAVAMARTAVPDLSLDIYGEGSGKAQLAETIARLGCGDCVRLCGFQKLDEVYQEYEAYVSASFVETLGVTLLEAVGAGLPIISYDIHYGAQVFVDEGKNGYRVEYGNVEELAKGIVRLFTQADWEAFSRHSYEKAESFTTKEIERKWKEILC